MNLFGGSLMILIPKDRKPGDFGLRGFYPADAKGQYDMQVPGWPWHGRQSYQV